MKRWFVSVLVAITATLLVLSGCTQAAPAPTPTTAPKPAAPTQAPAAPTKAAEPTKAAAPAPAPTAAPTGAPTAASAKKVDFPQKGKAVTVIIPFDAGGPTDIQGRLTAQLLEKELGGPVEVINKPGASGQVGTTEMLRSRPDGYTMALISNPTNIIVYLDPQRKAGYSRKDCLPLVNQAEEAGTIGVPVSSPMKELKDLVDAAKAKPEQIKLATVGAMSNSHLWAVMLEKAAGIKFALVHFSGSAPATAAVLGGHVDAVIQAGGTQAALVKQGQTRVLGLMAKETSKFFPGVKTFEQQGYPLVASSTRGYAVPAGTPKEMVDVLVASLRKVTESAEFKVKMEEQGLNPRFMDSAQYAASWDESEAQTKPLMELLVTK